MVFALSTPALLVLFGSSNKKIYLDKVGFQHQPNSEDESIFCKHSTLKLVVTMLVNKVNFEIVSLSANYAGKSIPDSVIDAVIESCSPNSRLKGVRCLHVPLKHVRRLVNAGKSRK